MTVLHIFSGDLWAGAEKVIFNLLKELSKYPDLRIIALSMNEGTLSDRLKAIGIETFVIPEATNSFMNLFLKAVKSLRGRSVQVIHSHRYKENALALLLGKPFGVTRLVSTIHGLSELPVHRSNGKPPASLKVGTDYFVIKHLFTRVVAVSRDIKHVLVERYGFDMARVDVIVNGIELPQLTKPPLIKSADQDFHIGTVGRMVPIKDFELYLEVAAEIKRQVRNVCFSILGDGPLKERLMSKARDLNLGDSISFESPRADPNPYYQSLDLYLNTSLHEGIPLSILEAMANGIPVVAPKAGGLPEIINHGEHGLLAASRNPREIGELCRGLIHNRDLRLGMGENASKTIECHFNSARMAASYHGMYHRLWN